MRRAVKIDPVYAAERRVRGRIDIQPAPAQTQPQYTLRRGAQIPACGAGVPAPARLTFVSRGGIHVGCEDERLRLIAAFLPEIDNWSVCDSFCSSLKLAAAYPEPVWDFLLPYLGSGREFSVRFAVVMLLFYYLDDAHIDRVLSLLDGVRQPDYYARMAVAWAVSIAYVRFPEKTLAYLKTCSLDDFTYNKALQKAVESRCVGEPARSLLRAMKR